MNESVKTICFVCFGIAMSAIGAWTYVASQPKTAEQYVDVGKPFFASFESADQAKSLEVSAIDPVEIREQSFVVRSKNNLWRIPTHHDYPAEAVDRLAQTASSIMGLEREAMVGFTKEDHARFGVVDPADIEEGIDEVESFGKRITLKDEAGEVLVDYIIGKDAGEIPPDQGLNDRIEGSANPRYYFVRRADEKETYKVQLAIDLSTKFSDWIEPDLLKLARSDMRRITINNYELLKGVGGVQMAQGDKLELTRADAVGQWELTGLNGDLEEVNASRVSEIEDVLDEMKIVGVRPKYKYDGKPLLTPELEINEIPELMNDPQAFNQLMAQFQEELDINGFNLIRNPELSFVGEQGEATAGTADGVVYTLYFGSAVSGDDQAIEIGGAVDRAKSGEEPQEKESGTSEKAEPKGDDDNQLLRPDPTANESDAPKATNRYLMIGVSFDEKLLGDRPVKPVMPELPPAPDGYEPLPAETDEEKKEEQQERTEPAGDEPEEQVEDEDGEDDDEDDEKPEPPPRDPAFVAYDAQLEVFEQQKMEHNLAVVRYDTELEAFEKKVTAAKAKVAQLNERFSDWYYVISANNLASLQSTRTDVVTKKDPPEPNPLTPMLPETEAPKPEVDIPDSLKPIMDEGEDSDKPAVEDQKDEAPEPSAIRDLQEEPETPAKEEPETPAKEDAKEPAEAGGTR